MSSTRPPCSHNLKAMSRAERWQLKNVIVKLPRCPACKGTEHECRGSRRTNQHCAVRKRNVCCRSCGWKFQIFEE